MKTRYISALEFERPVLGEALDFDIIVLATGFYIVRRYEFLCRHSRTQAVFPTGRVSSRRQRRWW